jgi:ribosomal protein L11 methyltransferase
MTIKATLTAAFPEARRISNFLERDYGDAGVAVSLDERADGLWSVDAYFESDAAEDSAERIAVKLLEGLGTDAFGAPLRVEVLPETNWVAAGLEVLQPVLAGRFIVHGSHDRGLFPGRLAIEIDAGQAFGTGHHATTAGCLSALDRLLRAKRYENPLDVGTGSGVLAIAMAKALRRPVLATDIDPVAVRTAAENAAKNGVATLVRAVAANGMEHPLIRYHAPFDLVVANILAEPLCRLAPRLAPLLARGGTLVLSGLLKSQRERVAAAYRMQGVSLETACAINGWSVLVMRRRG